MSPEPFVSRAKAPPAKRSEKVYGDENGLVQELTRPQSSSYNTRQRKSCARGRGAGDDGDDGFLPSRLALPFSVPISPCALRARCMKTTGDDSGTGKDSII